MASLYKRGKTWWGRVQKNGIERRRSLRTSARAEALKRLKFWTDELENADWGEKPRVSFRDAMTLFIEQHCPTLKPAAAQRYIVSARALFRVFGDMQLDEIGRREWRDYMATRRAGGVTGSSLNRDRACLSKMFAVAIDAELYQTNPVPTFERSREAGRIRFLSQAEYRALIADAADGPMRSVIIVAVNTGMRLGEILSLSWSQIDLDRGEILIPKTKTDEPRSIPLPPPAAAQIQAQRNSVSPKVFGTLTKSRDPVAAASHRFSLIARKAGVGDVRFHDLRHTFASWAVKGWHEWQDRPMRRDRLQLWLGHRSPAMTARYAHLETEDLHSEMRRTNTGTDATDF